MTAKMLLQRDLVVWKTNVLVCLLVRVVTPAITANIETRAPTPHTHPTPCTLPNSTHARFNASHVAQSATIAPISDNRSHVHTHL